MGLFTEVAKRENSASCPHPSIIHCSCLIHCMYSAPGTLNSFAMLILTVLLEVENIADFGPSAQPINPKCQLKNTFAGTNDSPLHSHFLFSNYPDHSPFQAQWEDELDMDRLQFFIFWVLCWDVSVCLLSRPTRPRSVWRFTDISSLCLISISLPRWGAS